MPLTHKARNIAVDELTKKLNLEAVLLRELRPLFNRINQDFRTLYATTGRVVNFSNYNADVTAMLRRHYTRTQKEFKNSVVQQNSFIRVNSKQNDFIDAGLLAWINDRLQQSPQAIIATTDKDADQSIVQAQESLIADGEDLTPRNIAITAAVFNRRKLLGRLTTISITETQGAAESTKLIEAEVLSGRTPFSLQDDPFARTRPREEPIKEGDKQWITVNDSLVRESHRNADRQEVKLESPFVVGGYQLRHPGDTSLGAPAVEWMNCRCSALLNIH